MALDLNYENNRIYSKSGDKLLAEIDFSEISKNICNISRTYVDDSLRGQGIADKLMVLACEKIREANKKAYPTCSYAVSWFKKHPDYNDIYIDIME